MGKFFSFFILMMILANPVFAEVWTIAIDPGHGGKDPGAIGRNLGIYEKNVTLSIAQELKAILDKDPNFRGVLTRKGDYYITVPDRSEIARRNRANYLVSIHADSSEGRTMRGASVWVLSNRRANDEMGQWLEDHEKQSELLGGAGSVLASHNERYLNQTVLDLQFGHSQRQGYELGRSILRNFAKITQLSRSTPQHASLGVLRSPDIPSVLVETGFLSNPEEEAKLSSVAYRRRIAYIIYQGIVEYRNRHYGTELNTMIKPVKIADGNDNKKQSDTVKKADEKKPEEKKAESVILYKVKSGDSLGKLAEKFGVKANEIVALNQLKRRDLWIGETLKIPATAKLNDEKNTKPEKAQEKSSEVKDSGIRYEVKSGDHLGKVAQKYAVKQDDIVTLNQLKRRELFIGQTLKIPDNGKATQKNAEPVSQSNKGEKVEQKANVAVTLHTVKKGETLGGLVLKYGVSMNDIVQLNPLKDRQLRIGEKIKIPTKGNATGNLSETLPKSENTKTAQAKQGKNELKTQSAKEKSTTMPSYHVIEKNQNLSLIAAKYGLSLSQLQKLNPNVKEGKLQVGQKIKLKE